MSYKHHIPHPASDEVLCHDSSWGVMVTSHQEVCKRCLQQLEKIMKSAGLIVIHPCTRCGKERGPDPDRLHCSECAPNLEQNS